MSHTERLEFSRMIAGEAGAFALAKFRALDSLVIESKGYHDVVSEADRLTEMLIRDAIGKRWPDDGIVGEEHGRKHGTSGYDWVIDPIDGTANYLAGIPHWCVVIACTKDGLPVTGVICDPNTGEMFWAQKGGGAFVNGKTMHISAAASLQEGSVAAGASGRGNRAQSAALVREILAADGMFFRSASGALMLAYVAAGRLIGYVEDHMNSWDCFAALLMVEEAGGVHLPLDAKRSLEGGTRLIASNPALYPALEALAGRVYSA